MNRYGFWIVLSAVAAALCTSAAVASPYSDAVMADNPIAYYRLEETAGATADNQGSGGAALDGSYIGPPTLGQNGPQSPMFPGLEADNNAPSFGGSPQRVEVGDNALLDITGDLTIEAWVNPANFNNADAGLVAKYQGAGTNRSYDVRTTAQGAVRFVLSSNGSFGEGTNSTQISSADGSLTIGQWTHVVATYDQSDTRMTLYIDGVQAAERTDAVSGVFSGAAPLWIGVQFDESNSINYFEGRIDEVAVYDFALDDPNSDGVLSDSRVLAHYNAAAVPEPTSFGLAALGAISLALLVWRRAR